MSAHFDGTVLLQPNKRAVGIRISYVQQLGTGGFLREAFEFEGRFFVNPGSATGAYHGTSGHLSDGESPPSFALMDVQGPAVTTYVYQLVDGDVKVEKLDFRKST